MLIKIIPLSFLLLFSLSNSKLEPNIEKLLMNVDCTSFESPLNDGLIFGKDKSAFSFKTDFIDTSKIFDPERIEIESQFPAWITRTADQKAHVLLCRFWKSDDDRINTICTIKGQVKEGRYIFNNVSFTYNGKYEIEIRFNCNTLKIMQYDFNIPFLYSPKQVINNNNDKDFFELKFNIENYNNEKLILYSKKRKWDETFGLENCEIKNYQLICKVSKESILTHASESLQYSYLITVIKELDYPYMFEGVGEIEIKNNKVEKKDIYVKITKLVKKVTESNGIIVYETNVTDILDLTLLGFDIQSSNLYLHCNLRKVKNDPLFLICSLGKETPGKKTLGTIDKIIEIRNRNINYDFFILPASNSEEFTVVEGSGGFPFYSNPQTFNYTKESSVLLLLAGDSLYNVEGISLGMENGNISCTYKEKLKKCDVPKSYFDGKANGDYYFYYTNKLGEKVRLYGLAPAKVILTEKGNNFALSNKPSILLFALLCLLF